MTPRQTIQKLIDALPDSELHTVQRFVEFLATQSEDDEPLTAAELEGIQRGLEDARQGRLYSIEEVERRLLGRSKETTRNRTRRATTTKAAAKK